MIETNIVILIIEGFVSFGLLAGIIVFSKKLKKLREQKVIRYEQTQKSTLDEMLKNNRRR